ncbi:MAG: DUF1778 domain-containing protein [Candidatus Dormibacteraeota bacterium]|nr:DUF1778 domain-containing protein [Candidatus Dormibacteraeota bacterium]
MKSVRLSPALEDRLRRAADASHLSDSDFIREAISERCDQVLGTSLYEQIKPFIGVVHGSNSVDASRSSEAFAEMLVEEFARQQEEPRVRRSS